MLKFALWLPGVVWCVSLVPDRPLKKKQGWKGEMPLGRDATTLTAIDGLLQCCRTELHCYSFWKSYPIPTKKERKKVLALTILEKKSTPRYRERTLKAFDALVDVPGCFQNVCLCPKGTKVADRCKSPTFSVRYLKKRFPITHPVSNLLHRVFIERIIWISPISTK